MTAEIMKFGQRLSRLFKLRDVPENIKLLTKGIEEEEEEENRCRVGGKS